MSQIINDIDQGKALLQSPYLYMQAAGSDGSDGSAEGIHLRWDFQRSLGDTHLPKGNLAGPSGNYPANGGFNRDNDFVTIFKAPYDTKFPVSVDFRTDIPDLLIENGEQRVWQFDTKASALPDTERVNVQVIFTNVVDYDSIRSSLDPRADTVEFLRQYTGVFEVQVEGELCFATELTTQLKDEQVNGALRLESISLKENISGGELYITTRKNENLDGSITAPENARPVFDETIQVDLAGGLDLTRIVAENIQFIRFDCSEAFPVRIDLEVYRHFILGKAGDGSGWQTLKDDFSLSISDTEVFERLENSEYLINNLWPKYFGAEPSSGQFTVNTANYRDRWLTDFNEPDENGIKDVVKQYLEFSRQPDNPLGSRVFRPNQSDNSTNPLHSDKDYTFQSSPIPGDVTSTENVNSGNPFYEADETGIEDGQGGGIDQAALQLDALDILKLMAVDYHVARMLGLGHIDTSVNNNQTAYIYLAYYQTDAVLEDGQAATSTSHIYASLPTRRVDFRLPDTPILKPLTYGFKVRGGFGESITIGDPDGYLSDTRMRLINLSKETSEYGRDLENFFEESQDFMTGDITPSVWYGVKYKEVSEPDWRAPELSNDEDYQDNAGFNETIPVSGEDEDDPNIENPVLFVHRASEEGEHEYAIYGINWFSRISGLSNVQSATTTFPIINSLLAPTNFAVQLIQPENPIVLTTSIEQDMLANLTSSDKTLVRVTFDWNHAHNIEHQYADKAQLFIRQAPPRIVKGQVNKVNDISPAIVEIESGSYSSFSKDQIETFDGRVLPEDQVRFKGSLFVVNKQPFVVEEVLQPVPPAQGAIFRLRKNRQNTFTDIENDDILAVGNETIVPEVGEKFSVIENLGEGYNWTDTVASENVESPLSKEIEIIKFSEYAETVFDPESGETTLHIGGIVENASITEIENIDNEGNPIPGSKSGVYEILFDSYQLPDHPDQDVEWYKGYVRIDLQGSGEEKKVLEVVQIATHGVSNFLKLVAIDQSGISSAELIQTGTGIEVNFHPSYRTYLHSETDVLDESTTLPSQGNRTKQMLMGIRAVDSTIGANSTVSTPAVLLSREIIIPKSPKQPSGAVFATRPDFYGKSTYTFDTEMDVLGGRKPFALVFYRANERTILETLYRPATVQSIIQDLVQLLENDAAFRFDRFRDLFNVELGGDGHFKDYIEGGYKFPNPDNEDYVVPDPDFQNPVVRPFQGAPIPSSVVDEIRSAIEGSFLPLTEQPVLFNAIRSGRKTSNAKPVIRDIDGELLLPTDAEYHPAPMAVKIPNSDIVRFTDYTLDGASNNIYFYYVKELNDLLQFSDRSPMIGPIRLINTISPEAPGIRKVTTQVSNPTIGQLAAVKIELSPVLASEQIKQVNLYRTANTESSRSVRNMALAQSINLTDSTNVIEITDDFSDLPHAPYGEPLFYRVEVLREIINEKGELEYVPSIPSKVMVASLVDNENPEAPEIIPNIGINVGAEISEVTLNWPTTVYNGTYYLSKMNDFGNWSEIYKVNSNEENIAFQLEGSLPRIDENGETIYHRFKVDVENSSGLLNLEEKVLII